ncbi:MAG: GAF domain-containing protein [Candidatus Dormibacteraeota bacterium]|nr:GAF domain-containing protein [Candidatus Dormibacteraeota bacterium]
MSLRIASSQAAFPDLGQLVRALSTCATEADLAQVLYARLSGPLGYDVVNLQVLERDGWMHRIVVDQGVLQDVRRLRVETSYFAEQYRAGVIAAGHFEQPALEHARGPGRAGPPRTYVWVPVEHRGQLVAAVIYQMHEWRLVDDDEVAFLDDLHQHLGALIVNAYLHQLTRNQALSLGALNDLAAELATTHDEAAIASGLLATLGHRVGIDALEIVVPPHDGGELRSYRAPALKPKPGESTRRRDLAQIRRVLSSRRPLLAGGQQAKEHSVAYIPIVGEQAVDAILVAYNDQPEAFEESTLDFLLQVADHVAPALHNAWSLAVREEQRRRLEAMVAVGRSLAGAVDRTTIVRALRDELSAHIGFDVFAIALIEELEGVPVAETYLIERDEPIRETAWVLERDGPIWRALESGRAQVLHGTTARALGPAGGFLRARHRSGAMRSHLLVPVPGSGTLRCEIVLQAAAPDAFTQSDARLVEDLGGQLRLALATADMFGRMRAVLENSPVGLVLQDASGLITFVNRAMASIYGVPPDRLIGHPATRLLEEAAAVPLDGDRPDGETRRYRLGTRDAVVEVRTVAVPAEGDRPASVLQLHEDVTREQTLQEAKDLMLRAIGHEVRSPAAAIRTTIAVLVDWLPTMTAEQQRALLESAYEQSERLLHIAEAQLMIAKLEQGSVDMEAQPLDVRESLDRVRRLLVHRYGDRALSVAAEVPPDLPLAMAVPTHFDEVLTNLIGNALEHTDSAGIRVVATGEDQRLRIAVEDHGGGLPSHRVNRIFERGGPPGSHRARGGLGLGLYLCRLIAERSFGGHIEVTRTGPGGTTIEFTVPARRPLPRVVDAEAPA